MEKVRVTRQALLAALNTNRKAHRDEFLKAQTGWRAVIVEELDRRLADARANRKIQAVFHVPEPEDHTKDYDRIIRMVDMEVADTIEINERDFACFVMDEWSWKAGWTASNTTYMGR